MLITEDCDFIRKNAPCRWSTLKNSKIFVTGGTGFFGKWLLHSFMYVNEMLDLNAEMTVLSRSPGKFLQYNPQFAQNAYLHFVKGDVREIHCAGQYDFVIHAATPSDGRLDKSEPDELYSIILDGTRNIIKNANQWCTQKMLYVSSGGVYGIQPPEKLQIVEDDVPVPVNEYGKGKLESEKICWGSCIPTVSARCFALIGPYQSLGNSRFAVSSFLYDAIHRRPIRIKDGTPYRSFLYASDLMIWLWTLLIEGKAGEAYNVGSDEAVTILEFASEISHSVTPSVGLKVDNPTNASIPPARYVPDIGKAIALGLKRYTSLADSIKKTIKWNIANYLNG